MIDLQTVTVRKDIFSIGSPNPKFPFQRIVEMGILTRRGRRRCPAGAGRLPMFYPHSELMQIAEDVELHLYFPLEESDLAYAARQMAKTYALPGEVAYPDKMLLHIAKNRNRTKDSGRRKYADDYEAHRGNGAESDRAAADDSARRKYADDYEAHRGKVGEADAKRHRDAYARRMAKMAAAEGGGRRW